jgi:hypothetical protein
MSTSKIILNNHIFYQKIFKAHNFQIYSIKILILLNSNLLNIIMTNEKFF